MRSRVVVLDFDGTLIDSNRLKYEAFFQLFDGDERHRQVIQAVLAEMLEASRYIILEEILRRLQKTSDDHRRVEVQGLANRYNEIVLEAAKTCPLITGVPAVLADLAPMVPLYVSSTTPVDALREIIASRNWEDYFAGVFGYPAAKAQTLQEIIKTEQVKSSEVLVVGDGESDRNSARDNGCLFIPVQRDVFPTAAVMRAVMG
ncbi:MAG: HAD family hydrolase [Deltaproteobacteria bacterium]|nr:HAD family hydrolase [Candidatus Anaeroferrophillus wilburensis]